jgi:hypothetical protein
MFIEFLKKYDPDVQIVGQTWPKLGETDFTTNITVMMVTKPDAVFDGHWGLDLATFMKQASMYGFLDKGKWFMQQFGEYMVIDPVLKSRARVRPDYIHWAYAEVPVGGQMASLTHPDAVTRIISDFLRDPGTEKELS